MDSCPVLWSRVGGGTQVREYMLEVATGIMHLGSLCER